MSWPRIVVSVPWPVALALDPRMTRTIGFNADPGTISEVVAGASSQRGLSSSTPT